MGELPPVLSLLRVVPRVGGFKGRDLPISPEGPRQYNTLVIIYPAGLAGSSSHSLNVFPPRKIEFTLA